MIQFTIRDVLLLTVIVALYLGWLGDRQGQAARIERLEAELKNRPVWIDAYQRGGRRDGFPINTEY
jgi:hypothetical protein